MAINLADFLPGDVKDPLSVAKLTETLTVIIAKGGTTGY